MLEDLRPKAEKTFDITGPHPSFFRKFSEAYIFIYIYICVNRFIYTYIYIFIFVYTSFKCWIPKLFTNNIKHIMFFPQQFKPEEYPTQNERYVCTENIGSLLADIGQVGIGRKTCGTGPITRYSWTRWWQLKYFSCSPLFGEDFQFDYIIFFRWVETTKLQSH